MKRTRIIAYGVFALIAIGLVAPLIMYAHTFGTVILRSHSRWAEFGTAMSGIYSPLLALLTLAVLVAQVFLQRRQTALQQQINDHERDQAYLTQARVDIEFYAARLAEALNSTVSPGVSLRAHLHIHFQPTTPVELDSAALRQLAASICHLMPSSFDLWAAVYPILHGMKAGKKSMFKLAYTSSCQKLVALLGFESCVALDNFYRARSEGRIRCDYVFSPLLSKE